MKKPPKTAVRSLSGVTVDEHTAITIISDKSEEIRHAIIRDLQRGVTIYKGRGGRSDTEQDILFCVVTRLEIGKIKSAVHDIDAGAFIVIHPLADAVGGVVKKLPLHS
ncbi:MAG: YitT family protein [Pyrinomonadaceae bacterium]